MDLWIQIFLLGKITFFAGGERDHREVENKDIKYSKTAMANNQFWSELTGKIGVLIQNFLSIPHSPFPFPFPFPSRENNQDAGVRWAYNDLSCPILNCLWIWGPHFQNVDLPILHPTITPLSLHVKKKKEDLVAPSLRDFKLLDYSCTPLLIDRININFQTHNKYNKLTLYLEDNALYIHCSAPQNLKYLRTNYWY